MTTAPDRSDKAQYESPRRASEADVPDVRMVTSPGVQKDGTQRPFRYVMEILTGPDEELLK